MKYELNYREGFFEIKTCGDADPGGIKEFLDDLKASTFKEPPFAREFPRLRSNIPDF